MSPDIETFYHLSIFFELESMSSLIFSFYNFVCFKMVYLLMMPSVDLGSRGLGG